MWKDPIVEEIHATRAELLASFKGDLRQYSAFVRTQSLEKLSAQLATQAAATARMASAVPQPAVPAAQG